MVLCFSLSKANLISVFAEQFAIFWF